MLALQPKTKTHTYKTIKTKTKHTHTHHEEIINVSILKLWNTAHCIRYEFGREQKPDG